MTKKFFLPERCTINLHGQACETDKKTGFLRRLPVLDHTAEVVRADVADRYKRERNLLMSLLSQGLEVSFMRSTSATSAWRKNVERAIAKCEASE